MGIPQKQQAIRDKTYHPDGKYVEFPAGDREWSVPTRFEKIAREHGQRLAVKDQQRSVNYQQFNESANQVAHAILDRRGHGAEPIAVFSGQSVGGCISIMSILKSGKFYVPLDLTHPPTRNLSILTASDAALIITDDDHLAVAKDHAHNSGVEILNIDALPSDLPSHNIGLSIPPDSYTYVIYTSGSTGVPKGVIENHRNILHLSMLHSKMYHISPSDRLSHIHSFCFSASPLDLFPTLLNGASLCPFDVKQQGINALAQWLNDEEITILAIVPPMFRQLVDANVAAPRHLRLLALIGDTVTPKDFQFYKDYCPRECHFVSGLGCTEVAEICWCMLDKESAIPDTVMPIGYEVEDEQVFIVDDEGKELGVNEIGEIAVRSRYISPGYWHQPDLTKKKFRPDPTGGEERLYLTGDMGLRRPDGCLYHKGRKDFQIKIRSYRVELDEVEWALNCLDYVKEAVVTAHRAESGESRLVAYIVPQSSLHASVSQLRRNLATTLPDYMIPSAFVFLDQLPINDNFKINRSALLPPPGERPKLDNPYVAPSSALEESIADIWAEVLGLDRVGIHDLFLELGGESLQAQRIVNRIREKFTLDLSMGKFLSKRTVAEMATLIDTPFNN